MYVCCTLCMFSQSSVTELCRKVNLYLCFWCPQAPKKCVQKLLYSNCPNARIYSILLVNSPDQRLFQAARIEYPFVHRACLTDNTRMTDPHTEKNVTKENEVAEPYQKKQVDASTQPHFFPRLGPKFPKDQVWFVSSLCGIFKYKAGVPVLICVSGRAGRGV